MTVRVGFGFDVHGFSDDAERPLVLGGVRIRDRDGLSGHSDADVAVHAIIDALLGAASLGDIGEHFPDTDMRWKGVNSLTFLEATVNMIEEAGFSISNVDCTIVAEEPRIAPHRDAMRRILQTGIGAPVNVKASRAEGLGAIGRVEGIACWAVATLEGGQNP